MLARDRFADLYGTGLLPEFSDTVDTFCDETPRRALAWTLIIAISTTATAGNPTAPLRSGVARRQLRTPWTASISVNSFSGTRASAPQLLPEFSDFLA